MSNLIPRITGATLFTFEGPNNDIIYANGIMLPRPTSHISYIKDYYLPNIARRTYLRQSRAQRIPNRFAPDIENTIKLYMGKHKKGKRKKTKPIFRRRRRN